MSLSSAKTTGAAARASSRGVACASARSSAGGVLYGGDDVGEREGSAAGGEGLDRPPEQRVFGRVQRPAEDCGDERGGEALAGYGVGGVVAGPGVHWVEARGATGVELHDRETEHRGDRGVLALRVEDRDEPAVPVDGE